MTKAKLFFNRPANKNVDSEVLQGSSEILKNGYFNIEGDNSNLVSRPGVSNGNSALAIPGINHSVGIVWWDNPEELIFVGEDGTVAAIYMSTASFNGKSLPFAARLMNTKLEGDKFASFCTNGSHMAIAKGSSIYYILNSGYSLYKVTDTDAPTSVTHIDFLNQYIVALDSDTSRIHWAPFAPNTAPTSWDASHYFIAESAPDDVIAMHVFRNVIHVFGTNTIEFWDLDSLGDFRRITGTTLNVGLMSRYSVANSSDNIYIFDSNRKFSIINGYQIIQLNTNYDFEIQNFKNVSDCRMYDFSFNGKNFIMCIFESENKTLVYDVELGYFAEWTYYDSISLKESRFVGNCCAFGRSFNATIFGSAFDNTFMRFDDDTFTDNGKPIRLELVTGNIDHGDSTIRKVSRSISMIIKSGPIQNYSPWAGQIEYVPRVMLSYRDDLNQNLFENTQSIDLTEVFPVNYTTLQPDEIRAMNQGNASSGVQSIKKIYGLGSYYSRQFRIVYQGVVKLSISTVIEDFYKYDF
tara:strand:- start:11919 stop:13484 length:1566 start_codon:yes stop_codon:yes gene_type:complete